jgi:GTPase SAR1 family protein
MITPGESLRAFLRECCERAEADLPDGRVKGAIVAVHGRLSEELLRVAVGGRLNAGKSTLVNSLLGEKLAATDATECTKLVSWFTFGLVNQVVIRLKDGTAMPPLPAQPLASALMAAGRPAPEVSMIEVQSSNTTLARDYTLIDTPGLDALSGLDAMSLDALAHADVLLYVMPHPGENDREALTELRAAAGAAGITALSTIGVLSRIDQLGDGTGDPWPVARRLAQRYGRQLNALVSTVVPVAGLLAETALGDGFTEADMRPLRRLHELSVADPGVLEAALYTIDDFRSHPALLLAAGERERLISLLGIYGIRVALAELDGGIKGAAALLKALRAHSGVDALLDQLRHQFVGLADALRAQWALDELDAVTWQGTTQADNDTLARLRNELDLVRAHPKLRQFGLMTSLADLEAGYWAAPGDAASELAALVTGHGLRAQLQAGPDVDTDELRVLLIGRITAWRTLENTSSRVTARHARAVREYLESLYRTLLPSVATVNPATHGGGQPGASPGHASADRSHCQGQPGARRGQARANRLRSGIQARADHPDHGTQGRTGRAHRRGQVSAYRPHRGGQAGPDGNTQIRPNGWVRRAFGPRHGI